MVNQIFIGGVVRRHKLFWVGARLGLDGELNLKKKKGALYHNVGSFVYPRFVLQNIKPL